MIGKALKSFGFQFVGSSLGFLFQFLAAGLLGAEEYGRFNYYNGFIGSIGVFFSLGITYYLPRIFHKYKSGNLILSKLLYAYFVILLILGPIIIYSLNIYVDNWYVALVILAGIVGFSLIEILRTFFVSEYQPVKGAFYKAFLLNLFAIILFFLFLPFDKTFWIILLSFVLSHLIIVIPFVVKRFSFVKPEWTILKGALPFYLIQILYTVYAHLSKVFQGDFQTFEIVGILSISIVIGKIISMLGTNFSFVFMPEFSKSWEEGKIERIKKYFCQISRINIYIILPIIIFLLINSSRILTTLGKGFEKGEIILVLILISSSITAFVGPNGAVLLMTGNHKKEIINGFIMSITGILLGLLIGRSLWYGIALSIAVAEISVAISKRIMTYKLLKISPYSISVFTFIIFMAFIQTIPFYFFSHINNLILWVGLNSLLIIFIIVLHFIFSPEKEDFDIIKLGMKNIKSIISKF